MIQIQLMELQGVPQGALEEDQDNQRTGKDQQGIEKEIKSVGRIPER
jgi:hypothetical protein